MEPKQPQKNEYQHKQEPEDKEQENVQNKEKQQKKMCVINHSFIKEEAKPILQQQIQSYQNNYQNQTQYVCENTNRFYSQPNTYQVQDHYNQTFQQFNYGQYPSYWQGHHNPQFGHGYGHYGFHGHWMNNCPPTHQEFNQNQPRAAKHHMKMCHEGKQQNKRNCQNRRIHGCRSRGRGKFFNNCWKKQYLQGQNLNRNQQYIQNRKHCKTQAKKIQGEVKTQVRQQQHNSTSQSDLENEQNQVQEQKLVKKMDQCSIKDPEDQKIQNFYKLLQPIFDKYNVPIGARHRSLQYILKKYQKEQQLNPLIKIVNEIQNLSPQCLSSPYFGLFVVIKTIFKKDFQLQQIIKVLKKKNTIKEKKQKHDSKFRQKFPNPVPIQFLQLPDLLKLNTKKTLFLVDCNNIMSKQKIFRRFFQSAYLQQKAEGQVRLAWLFCQTGLQCQLFFDHKYEQQLYKNIKESILSKQQQKQVDKMQIVYADKHINEKNTADDKIMQRLFQISQNSQYNQYQIMIISADQQLLQICKGIHPGIRQSSGQYIFKYCKQMIRDRYFDNKNKKGIIKDIFTF